MSEEPTNNKEAQYVSTGTVTETKVEMPIENTLDFKEYVRTAETARQQHKTKLEKVCSEVTRVSNDLDITDVKTKINKQKKTFNDGVLKNEIDLERFPEAIRPAIKFYYTTLRGPNVIKENNLVESKKYLGQLDDIIKNLNTSLYGPNYDFDGTYREIGGLHNQLKEATILRMKTAKATEIIKKAAQDLYVRMKEYKEKLPSEKSPQTDPESLDSLLNVVILTGLDIEEIENIKKNMIHTYTQENQKVVRLSDEIENLVNLKDYLVDLNMQIKTEMGDSNPKNDSENYAEMLAKLLPNLAGTIRKSKEINNAYNKLHSDQLETITRITDLKVDLGPQAQPFRAITVEKDVQARERRYEQAEKEMAEVLRNPTIGVYNKKQ